MAEYVRAPSFQHNRDAQIMLCGVGTLDGSNPTSIETGMANPVGAVLTLIGSSAPGDNTSVLTYVVNGTAIDVYAWKNTSGTDPSLVASTGTETFGYVIFGK